jgi:hypothetical protein
VNFVVTSVASEASAEALRTHSVALDALLNAAAGGTYLCGGIDQITLVLVSVDDEATQNAAWARKHDRLGSFIHPISGERLRYLSISAQVPPSRIVSATPEVALAHVCRALETALAVRPRRLPRGFPFSELAHVVSVAIAPWSGVVA